MWKRQRGSYSLEATWYKINRTTVKIFVESLNIKPLDNSDNVEATTCGTFRLQWQCIKLFAVAFTKLGCRCSQIFAVAQTLVVGVCKLLPQRSRILLSLIFKRCNEISFVVAVLLLSCLRNLLLLCLLNDVVVTLLCRLPTAPPTLHPIRTSTHPPSSGRHFRSRKTGNTGGEYLYNNCFFRFLFTNEKTKKRK